jgi:hypothetical protein
MRSYLVIIYPFVFIAYYIKVVPLARQGLHQREHGDGLSEKEDPSPDPFRIAVDEANDKTLLDESGHSVRVRHGVLDFLPDQVT